MLAGLDIDMVPVHLVLFLTTLFVSVVCVIPALVLPQGRFLTHGFVDLRGRARWNYLAANEALVVCAAVVTVGLRCLFVGLK